ncbi:unnamed protein product [Polarella glacialis]|uniref:Uncharacterized protein n=1 Tax=Polarella glacialis TaxID=89957 RepID=A0A813I3G6_POLGL|nr:unnamed protein product [Polarella glacialis]
MDVDVDNFEEALALFAEHLPKATFVAVDLEMTGITGPPETQTCAGDVPQVQYSKARKVLAQPLNIVQVGLCLFEETSPGHFDCRPFNVFVFPRAFQERDARGNIVRSEPFQGLSSSAAAFLAGNGLDFQRWVTKGVSYVDAALEEELLRAMPSQSRGATATESGKERVEPSKPSDIQLLQDVMKQVDAFVAAGGTEMKLPKTNNFMALVFRQRIAERHPGLMVQKRPSELNPNVQDRWVLNLSDANRHSHDQAIRQRLLSHLGFLRMWNLLKKARLPVVLHNGFMDLLFLASALEGPLPAQLSDLKEVVGTALPVLFDTKVLAESPALAGRLGQRTSLGELATNLAERLQSATAQVGSPGPEGASDGTCEEVLDISFTLSEGFRQYAGDGSGEGAASGAFHTAGYDAYETGRVFAFYRSALALGAEGERVKLETFRNRIFLLYSAFELRIGAQDGLQFDGIVRHLSSVDTAMLNNRGLSQVLQPLTEEGKRRAAFRWCSSGDSLLLILHGHPDTTAGHPGRETCESILDNLLQKQADFGRLESATLEEYLEEVEAELAETAASATSDGHEKPSLEEEAPSKRQRRD